MQNRERAQSAATGGAKNSLAVLPEFLEKRAFYRAIIKRGLTAQLTQTDTFRK